MPRHQANSPDDPVTASALFDSAILQELLFSASESSAVLLAVELLGFATGVACVFLIARGRTIGWPIGIVNAIVYTWLFWRYGLYSDSLLYLYFLAMQVYGWWAWTRPAAKSDAVVEVRVRRMRDSTMMGLLAGLAAASVAWGYGMRALFDTVALPFHDAATTVFSVAAQFLMARRHIECWVLWMGVNVLSPMNYLDRGMVPTAVLYGVYLGLAFVGWATWRKAEGGAGAQAGRTFPIF